ncbi:CCA tRNA nucleotidyltransferase [Martelella soudanensis]|uniref:CCA tRNA nucleotidyltransferase n=1 Tax=unclassified Martelella TaxID=2629616 RepID=UPI0015DD5359|nr:MULTISPECIES: CCA tRNA nucleotidyltransferase [unclassified Martelella]
MIELGSQDWFNDDRLRKVLRLLNGDGGETRIVGGAVRNALMGVPVGDTDLATTLLPDAVIARARESGMKAIPTGIDHGTVTVVCDGKPFEVTTLRADVETFGRHATVRFGTDWAEDAARRDFTINALYADADGKIHDPVGGLGDIETKTVRFIGEAETRIREDYLRILRFFRFFAWYGGGRPDAEGLRASVRARDGLASLSAERVWAETKKLLAARDPSRALLWMRQTGVLTAIVPESEKWGIDAIPALIDCEASLGWRPDPYLRLAAIIPPYDVRVTELADRLRLSNAERALLLAFATAPALSGATTAPALRKLLYRNGRGGILIRLKLALATVRGKAGAGDLDAAGEAGRLGQLVGLAETWEKPQMPLSGGDIVAAGVSAGPQVGDYLKKLEEWWVDGDFKADRAALAARLETLRAGKA